MSDPWIQTYSGKAFRLLYPDPADVDPVDLAHHLSLICRFSGAVRRHYSVGQHCVYAFCEMQGSSDPEVSRYALSGLLHDAHEAYLGDITSPVKAALRLFCDGDGVGMHGDGVAMLEGRLARAVHRRFDAPLEDLPSRIRGEIKRIDLRLLVTEARDLKVPPPQLWDEHLDGVEPYPWTVDPWPAEIAERAFLERLLQQTGERL